MCVIIDDFVFFDHFCYANQIRMLGFLIFTIYYLTPHVLRKRIRSYLCYLGTFPNTHFLNPMNMIVIAYYAHACHPV